MQDTARQSQSHVDIAGLEAVEAAAAAKATTATCVAEDISMGSIGHFRAAGTTWQEPENTGRYDLSSKAGSSSRFSPSQLSCVSSWSIEFRINWSFYGKVEWVLRLIYT